MYIHCVQFSDLTFNYWSSSSSSSRNSWTVFLLMFDGVGISIHWLLGLGKQKNSIPSLKVVQVAAVSSPCFLHVTPAWFAVKDLNLVNCICKEVFCFAFIKSSLTFYYHITYFACIKNTVREELLCLSFDIRLEYGLWSKSVKGWWRAPASVYSTTCKPKKTPLKNCWGASATCKPLTNHLAKHWKSAEEPLKNCWGASTTHTSQKSWGTTEELLRCYTAPHSPPKEPAEEMLRTHRGAITSCNH